MMERPRVFAGAEALADAIIAKVGKTIVLALPLGLGKANTIANALYARAVADPSIKLTIFTALTLEAPRASSEIERRFIGPLAARLFAGYPELAYGRAARENKLPPNIQVDEFFFLAGTRLRSASAQRSYISANYSHAVRYVRERGVNVIAQLVARRGDRLSLSCNPDLTLDLLDDRRAGRAEFVIAGEVNSELPFMPGDGDLAPGKFDYLLDDPSTDFRLFAPPREPIDLAEYAAGLHAARTVEDGGTIQLGIGSLGDAVAQALVLRHRHNEPYRNAVARLSTTGSASFQHDDTFATGLYGASEMFVESFLDLHRAGVLKREADGAVLHAGFFVGARDFYRALREMTDGERRKFQMTRISFVNELYGDEPRKRAARVKARFINNAMMATLLGAVVSDALEDGRVVSGVGGQYNFVAQSFALEDARSVILLRSTRSAAGRVTSNILWNYGHTTIPRHLRDIVVTEYGVADLRGKSDRDVIAAMLAITDSRFQDGLLRQAKNAGKIEPGYEIPAAQRDNTPARLAKALGPMRDGGLLPAFPFGCDFTEVEQRLLPALDALKSSAASPLKLASLALAGLGGHDDKSGALARMGLAEPRSLKERFYAALIRGALRRTES
jgi:acyl-CoA hydrolase